MRGADKPPYSLNKDNMSTPGKVFNRNILLAGGASVYAGQTKIIDGTTGAVTADIQAAAGSIGTAELADGAVTTDKLGAAAVTGAKIANNAITAAHIADGTVVAAEIGDGTVGSAELATGAVTAGKIGVGGISAANQFAAGVIDGAAVANGSITAAHIADGTVVAAEIGDGTVGAAELAAQAVTLPKMERRTDGSIIVGRGVGADVAEVALSGDVTMNGSGVTAIGAGKIVAGMIAIGGISAANQFAAGVVDAAAIATGAVGSDEIAANAVSLAKVYRPGAGALIIGQGAGADAQEHTVTGDVTMDGAGATTIANAAVSPAKASASLGTNLFARRVMGTIPSPDGANHSFDFELFKLTQAYKVASALVAISIATSGSDATNRYRVTLRNLTDNVDLAAVPTATNGNEFSAGSLKALVVDVGAASIAANKMLGLRVYQDDDIGAGPTDLANASVDVQVEWLNN